MDENITELRQKIQKSFNYIPKLYAFPLRFDDVIPARATFNGSLDIEPGTYIMSIDAYSQQPDGFKWQIYDEGGKINLNQRTFGDNNHLGNMGDAATSLMPVRPNYMGDPLIVVGRLHIEITNQANVNNQIQLALKCAVPLNSVTRQTVEVRS